VTRVVKCRAVTQQMAFQQQKVGPNTKVATQLFNPLNPELNPVCYLLALL